MFSTQSGNCIPHLSLFLTLYLYLLLNWKGLKLAYQVKGKQKIKVIKNSLPVVQPLKRLVFEGDKHNKYVKYVQIPIQIPYYKRSEIDQCNFISFYHESKTV